VGIPVVPDTVNAVNGPTRPEPRPETEPDSQPASRPDSQLAGAAGGGFGSDAPQPRSVLVTGGNRGIGRAIVEVFSAAGDTVTATYREGAPPDGVGGPGQVHWVRADVRDTAAVDEAFAVAEAVAGPVEVAVANAGTTRDTLLLRLSDEDWDSVLDTNLGGALRVARRATRAMMRARRGRIVLISSVVGLLGSAGQVNYAASKSGMVGMARSLARELGGRGITVNVVAPGFVHTDMTGALSDARREQILAQVPLGRLADPAEIAGVVSWLAGPAGGYVTGAVIPVDGGLGMGH